MCGIFGIISSGESNFSISETNNLLELFYRLSESRGKEASGAAIHLNGCIDVYKAAIRGRDFLRLSSVKTLKSRIASSFKSGQPFCFMGHTRMVTNGNVDTHGNNQPVIRKQLVAIHNGIVINDEAIWEELTNEERRYEVDTEVILALLANCLKQNNEWNFSISKVMSRIKGANTVAIMNAGQTGITLATSNGSMFYAYMPNRGLTIFSSEQYILDRVLSEAIPRLAEDPPKVHQLLPGQIAVASEKQPNPVILLPTITDETRIELFEKIKTRAQVFDNVIGGQTSDLSNTIQRATNISSDLEALCRISWEGIAQIKRCTKCILPETFPFLTFDEDGICSVCRAHKPLALKGDDALRRLLQPLRRKGQKPEVLFPISGGRDSCYGLHLLVKNYDIKPVAYTYDWGMVTDLARRNISRMCGELGVEHILISADIRGKRENIRKNVEAWLKTPHLGAIPLFMAGDKQFFYYANKLKDQMSLDAIVFSMNPLERTDFKIGFCGINETYEKQRHYDPNLINKIRLASFYAWQFVRNPSYLNSSLLDSIFAYLSYYFITKDFFSIFDYLPWNEEHVNSTLMSIYDWETSSDARSTWRIGDGTSAFYNYIYLKVAGFTESDTFRSNQIREGLISRKEALERINHDNYPRVESMTWYFNSIGLDSLKTIRIINKIKPLHPSLNGF